MKSVHHEFFAGFFGIGIDACTDHDRVRFDGQEFHLKRETGDFVAVIGNADPAQIFKARVIRDLIDVVVGTDEGFDGV